MTVKNLLRVKSVMFNGKSVTDWKLRQADILVGATLVFEMGK